MIVPAWVLKAIVTTIIGLLLTGVATWSTHISAKANDHEKRIAVSEQSLGEIKSDLKEQRQDMKEVLRRLPRRP